MYLLTNEIYITYQTGFSFGRLGQAQGWDLGYRGGLGVKKKFFPKFNQILCVSYSHEWHMHRHNFLGPPPWGLGKGQRVNYRKISLRAWGFAMARHRMCSSYCLKQEM